LHETGGVELAQAFSEVVLRHVDVGEQVLD
jgi:hypothetical protein